jgi:hypothetical protein
MNDETIGDTEEEDNFCSSTFRRLVPWWSRGQSYDRELGVHSASAVKIYNATSSLVRFAIKNAFFDLEKRSCLLQRRRCKFRSRRIGS